MSSPVTFHVGLHKTGTTFLQQAVFPVLGDLHLVLQMQDVRHLFKARPDQQILVTHEGLSGHPFQGAWKEEFDTYMHGISRLFPESKCIIGFRRHDRLVRSLYKQYLQEGGTQEPDFLFAVDGSGLIQPEELLFRDRLDVARRCFSDVFVYTQEGLRTDFEANLRGLATFLGTDAISPDSIDRSDRNTSIRTDVQARLLRTLNRVDHRLKQLPLVPTLHNPLFRRLRLTPRAVCQHRLSGLTGDAFELPKSTSRYLQEAFADDWDYVQTQRSIMSTSENS